MIRSYLELVLELPWKKATQDVIDIQHTREVLAELGWDAARIAGALDSGAAHG